jgi:hypothetical protein
MLMRFRGGGVGHSSTRSATNSFKIDRDQLDMILQQIRKDSNTQRHPNMEEGDSDHDGTDHDVIEMDVEKSAGEREIEGEVDEECQLSESELVDYGYEPDSELGSDEDSEEDDDDREAGEEDDTTVDELGVLGYADY